MNLTARLDVDANRDREIEADEPGRWDWTWAANGTGAIVVPDLDQERAGDANSELTEMRLVVEGQLPEGVDLALSIDRAAAGAITIYRRGDGDEMTPIVGAQVGPGGATQPIGGPLAPSGETLLIQGRSFPDISFRGLIEIFLITVKGREVAGILDSVLLRVSPWIMTPNTLEPERVYVIELEHGENAEFLEGLKAACREAGVEVEVFSSDLAGGDRWMQDEIEFGYAQSPTGTFDVVCDGPRNRALDYLAEAKLKGPDLGVIEIGSHLGDRSTLDAFGNLEVAPPVTVDGTDYPLGRIVFGNRPRRPSDALRDRRPALRLREFLYAQEVQAPFEIHSDWLAVGHVDEIISFVSAPHAPGFELLIASPDGAKKLFEKVKANGHEDTVLWEGRVRVDPETGATSDAAETVKELLAKTDLWSFNDECQKTLDQVKADLQRELGLDGSAIREIPVMFKPVADRRALAYFPDMVNHLVLGDLSVVPKPYGPKVDGKDLLEEAFIAAVPHRKVRFIDDWIAYHEMSGEVHCGTNCRRKPPADVRWWEHRLPGMHDASVGRRA
jgi:Protein-arginine deiminase (PAD)/Protein-arginine deiminase (PAD) middle domain